MSLDNNIGFTGHDEVGSVPIVSLFAHNVVRLECQPFRREGQ